jgi:hypothetical protein
MTLRRQPGPVARRLGAILVLVIAVHGATALHAPRAADLGLAAVPPDMVDARIQTESYLRRFAVLLMIRSSFNVVAVEEIEARLVAEAMRVGAAGPHEDDQVRLDRELTAEASYYLVSLQYLTVVGGAVWPDDRPEVHYASDALVALESLAVRLQESVLERTDPLPVLEEAQRILALTEGYRDVPPDRDRFGGRDELVTAALAAIGSRLPT